MRWGDTLYRIAVRYGTSVSALMNLNGITNPNYIVAGQTICVKPGGCGAPGASCTPFAPEICFESIAARYGWGTWYLANVNHIANPDRIYVGQVILIPYH